VFPITYETETRRAYAVVMSKGKQFNVGQALAEKYAKGIGWPGQWIGDATQVCGLSWQVAALLDGSTSTGAGRSFRMLRPHRFKERIWPAPRQHPTPMRMSLPIFR
jgi:hypothetical protein